MRIESEEPVFMKWIWHFGDGFVYGGRGILLMKGSRHKTVMRRDSGDIVLDGVEINFERLKLTKFGWVI